MVKSFFFFRLFLSISVLTLFANCEDVRRILVAKLGDAGKYEAEGKESGLNPIYTLKDEKRKRIKIKLTTVGEGLIQPTDLLFVPESELFLVAEKTGDLKWSDPKNGSSGTLLKLSNVKTDAEEGFLGIALHPSFPNHPKIYFNYVIEKNGKDMSIVSEWIVENHKDIKHAKIINERIIMELEQPYSNHNGGQLAFGPDGKLYIGWGDGGWKGDPKGNGQNPKTMLGSMLRISVDSKDPGKQYSVPKDNPFVGDPTKLPETFAYGFRNPWRYSFDPAGKLILADVGQDLYEEIDVVEAGKNYGWNKMEGLHCFEPKDNCDSKGLTDPIYEYGREDGSSITGGYVITNDRIPELQGHYIFADFVSGRIWAIAIPKVGESKAQVDALTLGKWPILVSTFGKDSRGNVYAADFGSGKVYRIDPDK
ncbi:dehydrogenase [Leptospira perolatii]|uniref:Dehydrogenase n=1 Tax=Leptospira perolatii TaxID=2023191 RepID=A0A2M9ZJN2_9LEPT|nr:PQQ-dependent sugar dehydrogenase [Leptospira perolatii]PJZ68842.1 dehydrogenase [Leptospira perolatii]PJZ72173.1 dehydrogenase [Leptospira perolatii]